MSVAELPKKVWRDSSALWLPHWTLSDGTTPLLNNAGGLYPKPHVKPVGIGIIHIEFWLDSYTDAQFAEQLNAANSGSFKGWDAGQAFIARIITEDEKVDDDDVVKMHYVVWTNELGWDNDFISMGYFYLDGTDKKSFVTDEGHAYIGSHNAAGEQGEDAGSADLPADELKRRISFSFLE